MNKREKLSENAIETIKNLRFEGIGLTEVARTLDISTGSVKFHDGTATNSLPRAYIKDENRREATIKRLLEKRGKTYKERAFLMYLQGKIDSSLYESAFYN